MDIIEKLDHNDVKLFTRNQKLRIFLIDLLVIIFMPFLIFFELALFGGNQDVFAGKNMIETSTFLVSQGY